MATDFDNAILSSDGFIPTKTNTPLDKRTRIESINEMPNIPNPFVGMIVYVSGEDKYYKIKTLKSKVIGGITVQNAQVDSYEVFESGSGGGESITVDSSLSDSSTNPVQNKVIKAELDKKAEKSDIPSLSGYATTQSVNNAISNAKSELNSKINENTSSISSLRTKVIALSGIDSPFVGYFDSESKLPAQTSPAWALVGNLNAARPYAYYADGNSQGSSPLQINPSELEQRDCSLGTVEIGWYMEGNKGKHKAFSVDTSLYDKFTVECHNAKGLVGFLTSAYNPPYASYSSIPYVSGTSRIFIEINTPTILDIPKGTSYIVLTTVDGAGASITYSKVELSSTAYSSGWIDLSSALGTYDFTNLDDCVKSEDSVKDYDLSISDRIGNVIAAFKDGHFRTKNFDSSKSTKQIDSTNNVDLEIADDSGNVIAAFKDGHFRTKNFDSKDIKASNSSLIKFSLLHWNIGHFNGGIDAYPNMTDAQLISKHIKAYKALFNQSSADVIGLCEYSNYLDKNSQYRTPKSILSIYHNVLEGKISSENAYARSSWFATDGIHFSGENYVDLGIGCYGLYTKINLAGKEIVLCELHTPWQSDELNMSANNALINTFKNYPYVVLSGDFNTTPANIDRFKIFTENGYEVFNTPCSYIGNTPTFPAKPSNSAFLDNICVKGGTILNARAISEVQIPNLIRKGPADAFEGAFFDNSPTTIKIGRDYVAEDETIYNLSDHLPVLCDITF